MKLVKRAHAISKQFQRIWAWKSKQGSLELWSLNVPESMHSNFSWQSDIIIWYNNAMTRSRSNPPNIPHQIHGKKQMKCSILQRQNLFAHSMQLTFLSLLRLHLPISSALICYLLLRWRPLSYWQKKLKDCPQKQRAMQITRTDLAPLIQAREKMRTLCESYTWWLTAIHLLNVGQLHPFELLSLPLTLHCLLLNCKYSIYKTSPLWLYNVYRRTIYGNQACYPW